VKLAKLFGLIGITLWAVPLQADLGYQLSNYVGYTIIAVKTIVKSVDKKGEKNEFEGCDYDRDIVFEDGTYVTCASYGYEYAYRPRAVVLSNGNNVIMLVKDKVYQVR
jgi:hypothetical protein